MSLRNAQLTELRARWEGVLIESGTSEPVEVVEQIRSLRTKLRQMQREISEVLGADGFDLGVAIPLPAIPSSLGGGRREERY